MSINGGDSRSVCGRAEAQAVSEDLDADRLRERIH
jgi:hypothetical protein